jgi:AraC-like DNA-binding protein
MLRQLTNVCTNRPILTESCRGEKTDSADEIYMKSQSRRGAGFTDAVAAKSPRMAVGAVCGEAVWRDPAVAGHRIERRDAIIATRWQSHEPHVTEASARSADDVYVVKIVLRTTKLHFSVAGKTVHDGRASAGLLHVTEPGTLVRGQFQGPFDILHLFVPTSLILEHVEAFGMSGCCGLPLEHRLVPDAVTERLGRTLLAAEQLGDGFTPIFVDCLTGAIVARLLSLKAGQLARSERKASELPKWRLKRAISYIDDRLAEPITLSDIASETGLSCMHFAAQFRATTGLRPHEYVLRRRIERAQELLLEPDASLVDVALSVGFKTQAHFTTIFGRYVGQSPHAWRVGRRLDRARTQLCTADPTARRLLRA